MPTGRRVRIACGSLHSGGANFAYADASVHFLTYAAAPILSAMATRSGGESIDVP